MALIGYARVSTDGQFLDAQIAELTAAGVTRIFSEKVSGAKTDRPELTRALAAVRQGDVLVVTRLDRFARSTHQLLNAIEDLTEKGVGFRSLRDAWADSTSPHGRLLLTILAGLAEFERELIKSRTGEGRERARARGVKLGRKPKLTAHQKGQALARKASGESVVEIARTFNVSHSTISRLRA